LHRQNKNLIVTGSNAHLLSEEFASALTGRHIAIEVFPFSLYEITHGRFLELADIEQYLLQGGFPDVISEKIDHRTYLASLWDSIIFRDIARRKKIRNINGLDEVYSLLLSGISSKYNVDSLVRQLAKNISAPTIKKFITYGEQAYLFSSLQEYSTKPKLRIKSDRKVYTIDNGFFSAKNPSASPNFGALFENIIFNELRGRGFKANLSMFYYVTRSGYEIDFLLRAGHRSIEAVQACYQLTALKTRERELRALYEISTELNIDKLTIITMNESCTEKFKNKTIEVVAAKDWFSRR